MVCVEVEPGDRCIKVAPGVSIFAHIEGEGKPIVLVHGWGLNHEMWKYQVPYLKGRGYQVIAIDLRGFGKSDKPQDGYDYDTWANDLGTVIQELDLQHLTLAGYSIGGAISMYYASKHADPRIEKLALVAAAGPCMTIRWDNPRGHLHTFWDLLISLINVGMRAAAFQQFFALSYLPVSPTASQWPYQWLYNMFMSASDEALIGGLKELRDQNLKKDLRKIRVKTRIFHGILDLVVPPPVAKVQQHLITGAILRWFLMSGHGLFFEEADKLSSELDW